MDVIEHLPSTTRLLFEESPDAEGEQLEFRLIYEGPLPSSQGGKGHAAIKHAIRKVLHKQLKELWRQYDFLEMNLEWCSQQHQEHGFRWIPLIDATGFIPMHCKLDILFLRRDAPGNLIRSGGDIDNRIKILFDGLRKAESLSELDGAIPDADEDPFFCLLNNDSTITEVTVTTDRLLKPLSDGVHIHDVVLIIRVVTVRLDTQDL